MVDRQGVSLVDQGAPVGRDLSTRPEIAAALRGTVASGTRYSQTLGHGLLYVAVPVSSGGDVYGAVRITYPTSEIDHRVYRYWLTLAAIGGIILVLTALVGVVLARWVARPLSALERTARRAGEGDLTVRADETRGPPEVRELAAELNVMVREVEQMVAAQRDFVADASHQLRTPLTALRLRLENLAHDVPADGKRQLEGATVETERLARIVDGLLVLARAEAPSTSLEPIGLEPLVTGTRRLVGLLRERARALPRRTRARGHSSHRDRRAVGAGARQPSRQCARGRTERLRRRARVVGRSASRTGSRAGNDRRRAAPCVRSVLARSLERRVRAGPGDRSPTGRGRRWIDRAAAPSRRRHRRGDHAAWCDGSTPRRCSPATPAPGLAQSARPPIGAARSVRRGGSTGRRAGRLRGSTYAR